jgi:hypothetical protein
MGIGGIMPRRSLLEPQTDEEKEYRYPTYSKPATSVQQSNDILSAIKLLNESTASDMDTYRDTARKEYEARREYNRKQLVPSQIGTLLGIGAGFLLNRGAGEENFNIGIPALNFLAQQQKLAEASDQNALKDYQMTLKNYYDALLKRNQGNADLQKTIVQETMKGNTALQKAQLEAQGFTMHGTTQDKDGRIYSVWANKNGEARYVPAESNGQPLIGKGDVFQDLSARMQKDDKEREIEAAKMKMEKDYDEKIKQLEATKSVAKDQVKLDSDIKSLRSQKAEGLLKFYHQINQLKLSANASGIFQDEFVEPPSEIFELLGDADKAASWKKFFEGLKKKFSPEAAKKDPNDLTSELYGKPN